jgi:hypothetical protein
LERRLIARDIFMSFGRQRRNARDVLFVERSVLMSPSECGGIEEIDEGMGRRGDREIRTLEKQKP